MNEHVIYEYFPCRKTSLKAYRIISIAFVGSLYKLLSFRHNVNLINRQKLFDNIVHRPPKTPLMTIMNHASLCDDTFIWANMLPFKVLANRKAFTIPWNTQLTIVLFISNEKPLKCDGRSQQSMSASRVQSANWFSSADNACRCGATVAAARLAICCFAASGWDNRRWISVSACSTTAAGWTYFRRGRSFMASSGCERSRCGCGGASGGWSVSVSRWAWRVSVCVCVDYLIGYTGSATLRIISEIKLWPFWWWPSLAK